MAETYDKYLETESIKNAAVPFYHHVIWLPLPVRTKSNEPIIDDGRLLLDLPAILTARDASMSYATKY
jgi:hypothetical protein